LILKTVVVAIKTSGRVGSGIRKNIITLPNVWPYKWTSPDFSVKPAGWRQTPKQAKLKSPPNGEE
jgi:hypothetical protein